MALKELGLTVNEYKSDGTQDQDVVRLVDHSWDTENKIVRYKWCVGKDVVGVLTPANTQRQGWWTVANDAGVDSAGSATGFTDLLALGTFEAMQDDVLDAIVTASLVGAGTKATY